ncbi:Fe-S cluster assembly sulfur transfer protein SufU [Komagataeibacter rhaeticus]|uniref:SUF system NifU family Fe-S cluster assembly protein n=1 Tax=Komagataeibacter rhaeticus TaxID=215221 RepID=A0A181CBX6_9PROT|nr:SUF system NifU family Fe-S cluster assembly protein [Komagataeibacter rhaeticus]ATU72066.1 SUF system NifU family Fe-S cluster assembly protein [Komagataeibacter xylinus]QIP35808.1 SUF system NifU family Fe-S cluster assembly protein [Komagataeibacter rhaeticus]QOC45567.1 SUF system NifU family Fe-S cluster assembly protein [Komagataeibacter rhaeticus]WPP21769.1 SUF system NifU family Fe-S cluster assembly protein [Komagataeibacter rhaeticus]SAY49091.1 NifU-like protein [Komagataeibacter r
MAQDDLYRSVVLERAKSPRHAGDLPDAPLHGQGSNPLCGDRVKLHAMVDTQGRIATLRHETRGCAICAASADLMAERVTGQGRAQVSRLQAELVAAVETGIAPEGLGELAVFAPLHQHRSRIRCAMLPWSALTEMLNDEKDR